MNILLIEPDRLLARTYTQALQRDKHVVTIAGTAQEGIHTADDQKPDLVILEMQLVSHSGIEFLYEFRSYTDWQQVPVLVLSQVPPAEFINSWSILHDELGVGKYLYKPRTKLDKLLRSVRDCAPVRGS